MDTLTEEDVTIIHFGLSGIANCSSDVTNTSLIVENDGLELIISCLYNSNEDCVLNALNALLTILDISLFLESSLAHKVLNSFTQNHLDAIKMFTSSKFKTIPNLASICIEFFEQLNTQLRIEPE